MNTIEAAVNMLRRHNRWRRGDDTVEAVDPALLGCAIDTVCDHIEKQAKVADDVVRLDFIISKGARVMSDQRDESPACYWLRWEEEEESEQNGSYPSPREAIDAAMRDSAMLAAQSAQDGK